MAAVASGRCAVGPELPAGLCDGDWLGLDGGDDARLDERMGIAVRLCAGHGCQFTDRQWRDWNMGRLAETGFHFTIATRVWGDQYCLGVVVGRGDPDCRQPGSALLAAAAPLPVPTLAGSNLLHTGGMRLVFSSLDAPQAGAKSDRLVGTANLERATDYLGLACCRHLVIQRRPDRSAFLRCL